jgi:glycosyltransferase involved in cell wall biosynthesis
VKLSIGHSEPRSEVRAAPVGPDVVVVHDYLTQRGGAERVVLSMLRAFPGAALVTSLYEPQSTYPEFRDYPVNTLPINHVRPLRRRHRLALPVLAPAFSARRLDAEVVVCSSSGWAHGVRTEGRKLVYCHTPARWLYEPEDFLDGRGRATRCCLWALHGPLIRWDRRAAGSADRYLVNSRVVQRRVRQAYGIEAEVLPPPHRVDVTAARTPVEGTEPGYFLSVARLNGYKHVEAVVEAFADLPRERLVVVGGGPQRRHLEQHAPSNVRFVGVVADDQLRWLYANCRALVAASYEDFGLTPVECAAFGRPAVVLRSGGYLDTLIEGVTGVSFAVPEPVSIRDAVGRLGRHQFDEDVLIRHATRYSEERFVDEIRRRAAELTGATTCAF